MTTELINILRSLTGHRVSLTYDTLCPVEHTNGTRIIIASGVLQAVNASCVALKQKQKTGSIISYIPLDLVKYFADLTFEHGDPEMAVSELIAQEHSASMSVGDVTTAIDK